MEWRVTYQQTPFNYTTPGLLIVEALSKPDAFIVAYDKLSRQGMVVNGQESASARGLLTALETMHIRSAGVPDIYGNTHILAIDKHNLRTAAPHAERTIREVIERTDWDLLKIQKQALIAAIERLSQYNSELEGLLAWIDHIQDAAHADIGRAPQAVTPVLCTCRRCKRSGPVIDEFTSPYTGLCAQCTEEINRMTSVKASK